MSGDNSFLGFTKTQFAVGIVCLVLILGAIAFCVSYTFTTTNSIHNALCTFKEDVETRHKNNQLFLDMTLAERIEKYGPQLGNIPEDVIEQSMTTQKNTLDSLSSLSC